MSSGVNTACAGVWGCKGFRRHLWLLDPSTPRTFLSTTMILLKMLETSIHPSTATPLLITIILLETLSTTPLSITVILLRTSKTSISDCQIAIMLEMSLHPSTPLHLSTMLSVLLKSMTIVLGQLAMWIHLSTPLHLEMSLHPSTPVNMPTPSSIPQALKSVMMLAMSLDQACTSSNLSNVVKSILFRCPSS